MIGFAGGTPGIVGALCGILACVASSILLCCAPKSTDEGGGKFTAVRERAHSHTPHHTHALARHPNYACYHHVTLPTTPSAHACLPSPMHTLAVCSRTCLSHPTHAITGA